MGIFSTVSPSSPVGSTYYGFPSDMDDWSCENWKQYYIRNKEALGAERAISIVNEDSYRISIFASGHWCPYDCDFVDYMASQGLDPSNIFSSVYCGGTKIVKNVTGAAVDTSKIVSNVTGAVSTFTGSKLLTIGLIATAAYIGYNKFVK